MSEWQFKKVKEVFDVQLGKMLSKKAKEGEMYPYLANFNVQWGRFDFSKMNEMNFNERERDKYELKKNDLLMCEGGEIGRCAVWQQDNSSFFYQKALHRLRARDSDEITPYFFYAYMQYICSTNALIKIVGETSIAHLTREKLLELRFPCPQKHLQDHIVYTLQTWDATIKKTEALIDAKERQFGWLKSKLIGQKASQISKLSDHFGKDIIIEKGKPLIKANIANNGNIPVIAGGKSSPYSHDQLTHSVPCITISASGAYAGYVWYHDYPIWASDCNVIYSTEHSTEYLYFALKMKQSRIYAFQSGGGQPHVYARDLKNISIPLPPLEEQKRIAGALNTAQQEITIAQNLAEQYRTQKRGLMQKLLTGKWEMKE